MSGSSSYLTSLFTSSFGSVDPILGAIFDQGSSTTSQNPVLALQSAETNETQDLKATAAQPAVQQALKAFTQAVNSAKSVTQLLANPAVMNVLLTANGMSDQIGYTALATKALTSNLNDPQSLANTLTDTRWHSLAETYNFAVNGLSAIQNPTAIASIAAAYTQATWQTSQDAVTPGLSNALAFKSNASSLTTVDQILGNPTARTVISVAYGIPQQIAFQSLSAQETAISSQLNVKQLQDPKFVESLVQRYLINNASSSSSTSTSTTPDLTTLAVQSGGFLA